MFVRDLLPSDVLSSLSVCGWLSKFGGLGKSSIEARMDVSNGAGASMSGHDREQDERLSNQVRAKTYD